MAQLPSYAFNNPASSSNDNDEDAAFSTADLLIFKEPRGRHAGGWRDKLGAVGGALCSLRFLLVALVLALCGATAAAVYMFTHVPEAVAYTPQCFMSLGGGSLLSEGNLPPPNPQLCTKEIQMYFMSERHASRTQIKNGQGGEYLGDVKRVADSAIQYFEQLQRKKAGSPDQVMVFDIDETVLSNAAEWMTEGSQQLPVPQAAAAGFKQQLSRSWDRPALTAVLALYHYLYAHHYSIAFITGRSEPDRNGTQMNLEYAGYGKPCPPAAPGAPAWSAPRGTQPCYVALHLRDVGDARWASIYKPERRQRLKDAKLTLVGNMGDQASDLSGLNPAAANWKLPNPVYHLL